ncbi:pentatricopeptide repeat-containing protein 2, mitochondrial isoform X3 [Channa argus]|uniref:pentatricopeptide repeat-containing protein 2, mitochondrial isoform X3 n=1 Tax=Channa argus TaxID=215402 RepID=UPI003521D1C8
MALGRLGKCCRSLLHAPSKGVFFGVLQPGWIESCIGAKRHLLSEDVIKLEDFQQRKLAVAHLVTGSKGNYIELFSQKLLRNELVLRDELKLLLHLCQSADDMVIARDAIYRYHAENRNLAYGEFKFGPLFMRLCYELGLEEMAAATITDKNMIGFFNDATSFNITIDMLFTKGLYENALEVLRTMRNQNISFNKDTLTLATGICYKLNTAESYRICTALIEEKQAKGYFIPRHAYCFAIALALRRVDLLRLQSEGGPHMPKVEQLVTQLEQAGQVIQQTLDDLLCHTHKGNRRKQAPVLEERRTSRRTLRPLQSTLLSE